jgi:hypothetical protein
MASKASKVAQATKTYLLGWYDDLSVDVAVGSGPRKRISCDDLAKQHGQIHAVMLEGSERHLLRLRRSGCQMIICGANVLWGAPRLTQQACHEAMIRIDQKPEHVRCVSCGGWREMTELDAVLLSAKVAMLTEKDNGKAIRIIRQHPVWRYVRFIRPFSEICAAAIIVAMGDPRFWIDFHGDIDSAAPFVNACIGKPPVPRLESRFGGVAIPTLAKLSERIWRGDADSEAWYIAEPGAFLQRTYQRILSVKHNDPRAESAAVAKTSQRFAHYLRACWYDALEVLPARDWFDPSRFFQSEPEVAADFRIFIGCG